LVEINQGNIIFSEMKFIVLFFLLIPLALIAQDTTTVFPVYNNNLYYNRKNTSELFTGVCASYNNDTLSRTVQFKKGVLVKEVSFYSNGYPSKEAGHNGNINEYEGRVTYYYKNGNKKWECSYKENSIDSTYTEWYEDGSLSLRCSYVGGKKEGLNEAYYNIGQLKEKGFYVNNAKKDQWDAYYENGNEKSEGIYTNTQYSGGYKTGLWTYWYETGQKQMEITYEQLFDERNQDMFTTDYLPFTQYVINDYWESDGTQTIIDGTGKAVLSDNYSEDENVVKLTTCFLNSKRTGMWIMTMYDECVKIKIPFNDNGNLDGKIIVLHCNGNVQWIYNYTDGSYVNREGFDK
jgi:antitoxin component YwqK of YwqJK toxin-antitoxin module